MNALIHSSILSLLKQSQDIGIAICEIIKSDNSEDLTLYCIETNNTFAKCLNSTTEQLEDMQLDNTIYDFNSIAKNPQQKLIPLLEHNKEYYKIDAIYDNNICNKIIFFLHPVGDYIKFYKQHITEKAQAKFLSFTHNSIVPMMISNLHDFVDYNQSYVNFLGYETKEELMQKKSHEIFQVYQPNGRLSKELYEEYLQYAIQHGVVNFEWVYLKKDGTEAYAEAHMNYNLINGNSFINITLKDITKTKQLEKELQLEHERLINEVSVPIIPIFKNILLLPLIGTLSEHRANLALEKSLQTIATQQSHTIIIDISGINPNNILLIINNLNKLSKAAKLMGCKTILSGISAPIANAIISSNTTISEVYTTNTLESALAITLNHNSIHF